MRVLPKPLPDELLYSVLARMAYHYGYWSPKQLIQRLYERSGVLAVPDLPCNLGELARATAEVWHLGPDQLAMSHSLVGYYTHFHGERRRQEVLVQMRDKGACLQVRLGICAGAALSPRWFRLCAHCRAEDLQRHGEAYWHRSHHLPGLLVCDRHGEVLLESTVPFRPPGRHEHVAPPLDFSPDALRPLVTALTRPLAAHRVAVHSAAMLESPARSGAALKDYRPELKACGLASGHGAGNRLKEAFRDYFGAELLAASLRAPPGGDCLQWLDEVRRPPRRPMHPYRHVLMEVFLDEHRSDARAPATIDEGAIGRRWCLYRDAGLRKQAAKLAVRGLRTHSIARALDVDWKTAARLLAPAEERASKGPRDQGVDREAWTELATANPGAGKKALRLMALALYARLYRNDRAWLLAFRAKPETPRRPTARVDWYARDAEMELRVRAEAAAVLAEVPMQRATQSRILGRLDARPLVAHNAARLPRTVATLKELCESVEAFHLRRLVAVLGQEESGSRVPDYRALREARIEPSRLPDGGAGLLALARARLLRTAVTGGGPP